MDLTIKESIVSAHGILMVFVWLVVVPAGIAVNMYGRKMQKSWGVKAHMATMALVAFVPFSVAAISGFAASGTVKLKPHSTMGTIIALLTWIQMIMGVVNHGLFRYRRKNDCLPKSRPWNNHVHIWLGRLLLTLSIINIGLGMRLRKVDLSMFILYGIWIFFLFCLFAYLSWLKPIPPANVPPEKEVGITE